MNSNIPTGLAFAFARICRPTDFHYFSKQQIACLQAAQTRIFTNQAEESI